MVNKKRILLLSIVMLAGCPKEPTPENCKEINDYYRGIEFNLVLSNLKPESYYDIFEGKDLNSNKDTILSYNTRWFDQFYELLSINDTVIKMKDRLKVEIRKKDTLYISEWTCGAFFINNVSVREFDRKKHYILR